MFALLINPSVSLQSLADAAGSGETCVLSVCAVAWTDLPPKSLSQCYISPVQLYEVVPCRGDCNQYVWVAEPWSLWKVSHMDLKQNCGEGVQTRKVR